MGCTTRINKHPQFDIQLTNVPLRKSMGGHLVHEFLRKLAREGKQATRVQPQLASGSNNDEDVQQNHILELSHFNLLHHE